MSSTQHIPAASGRLLLSEPFLHDPNFNRTVILLCDHSEKGSFGFIINRQMEFVIQDVMIISTDLEVPLYTGGPVEGNTLHFIHRDESLADSAIKIMDGLYWGGDFNTVITKIENNTLPVDDYRFFIGYSGWGEEQLKAEIDEKTWIVANATPQIIFEKDNETMWKSILVNMGGLYKALSNSPDDPQMN
ncbi:MAG: YqgE/AlgH family protein [Bacteroidetes bacterium]|nr:YqgE/AlgH family protein [Bacteroidota bacterium]